MILEIDRELFYLINHWRNPLFDVVMPWFSDLALWLPVAVPFLVWRLIKGDKRERIFWFFLIIGIVATDFVCARLLKPLFGRPRPYLVLDHVYIFKHGVYKLLTHKGVEQGMRLSLALPSCHASNCSFFAAFLSMEYKKALPFAILIVVLVGYSRIYLGAHYPLDIMGGAVVGTLMALAVRRPFNLMSSSPGKVHQPNR